MKGCGFRVEFTVNAELTHTETQSYGWLLVCWTHTHTLTRVDPEEAGGAAEVLPGEGGVLQEVTDEDVV